MPIPSEPYWLVIQQEVAHGSTYLNEPQAIEEANAMAKLNPGQLIHVIKCVVVAAITHHDA